MRQAIEGRLVEYRDKLHEAERDAYCEGSYRTRLQGAIAELEWVLSLLDAGEKAEAPRAVPVSSEIECVGHGRGGTFRCCSRAGEYNGFGSGPTVFTCPKGCSCHD